MSTLWIVLGICVVFVLAAAIPLLRGSDPSRDPPLPRKETLHDWRNDR
ncbi:MAG: hypothetical protein JNN21_13705 [Candidatus Accumulibacter sp.]|mgnify:CR=1 FL=1|jgi:hypothetical protein|nr:hypothetical protein [Accumulibacter sp.]